MLPIARTNFNIPLEQNAPYVITEPPPIRRFFFQSFFFSLGHANSNGAHREHLNSIFSRP